MLIGKHGRRSGVDIHSSCNWFRGRGAHREQATNRHYALSLSLADRTESYGKGALLCLFISRFGHGQVDECEVTRTSTIRLITLSHIQLSHAVVSSSQLSHSPLTGVTRKLI